MSDWVIHGASALHGDGREPAWESRLQELTPVPAIDDQVQRTRTLLPQTYVGVQIRASPASHSLTLEASPASWFIARMGELVRADPQTHFFLSCDDRATERQVRETIPNVTTQAAKGGYNTVDGVRAAVADLYLLAGSTHLLGRSWSSFVDLAWLLGGKSQVLENSVHRYDPPSAHDQHPPVDQAVRPPPSEIYVRNPVLVAMDRIGVRRRAHRGG